MMVFGYLPVYICRVGKQFDPNAILFRWAFREDDDLPRLIGTDPALADRSKFFRWVDEPGGWERREPWPRGAVNVEVVPHGAGTVSLWPGAIPLRARPDCRPQKEYATEDDRPVTVSLSLRRAELFEIQRRASVERKTVSEWLAHVMRTEIASGNVMRTEIASNNDSRVGEDEDAAPCLPQKCTVDGH